MLAELNALVHEARPSGTVDRVLEHPTGTRLLLLAPVELRVGQSAETFFAGLLAAGYVRVRIDGRTQRIDELGTGAKSAEATPLLDRKRKSRIEIVIDRIQVDPTDRSRLAQSVEAAFVAGRRAPPRGAKETAVVGEAAVQELAEHILDYAADVLFRELLLLLFRLLFLLLLL